jgi:predicted CoA-binding protein
MSSNHQRVAVIGASDNPDRYSYKAIQLLKSHGHTVLPVTPKVVELPGLQVHRELDQVPPPVDTVTVYVNPGLVGEMVPAIVRLKPGRVIFNPGTENPEAARQLEAAGIRTEAACTLVLLTTGQF